jgi:hypothetical protein
MALDVTITWIRLARHPGSVLNLERYSQIEVVPGDEDDCWEVLARPAKGDDLPITRLFAGTKDACDEVVDEIAKLVWAMEVP